MKDRLESAMAIAREVGALQRERVSDPHQVNTKSSDIDLVTEVDHASDALILERIGARYPEDAILTEETGAHAGGSEVRWIVDPLDGTTNYAHGFPHFAVSIGIERNGEREAAVIYDPMKDELFSALRGSGAFMNGKPISVSRATTLKQALLATGFAYDVHRTDNDNVLLFNTFIKQAQGVRRAGSAALDLAYVACGRFDGFWELNLHAWDVAAGILIIEEAGGRTSDLRGGPVPFEGDRCVASNGALHDALLEVIATVWNGD